MGEQRELQVLGGRVHPRLTQAVAKKLQTTPCEVNLTNFASGEISCRIDESVRGNDVFIIQTHGGNVNDAIMEQAIMIDAAKRASAASITAVCPYMGYARQDRKSNVREPITARLVIDILANAGADRIMSIDLHTGQIQGFFDGPFDHLVAMPLLVEHIKKQFKKVEDLVIVSPDAGRAKTAERYSSLLGCDLAIVHKQRSHVKHHSVEAKFLIGDVKNKTCLVIDDMIDTAGTLCAAADLLQEHGAAAIHGVATHGVLSDPALKRLEGSAFQSLIITDSLPLAQSSQKITVVSVAPLLADAIRAVHTGTSVSALFNGKNQY